MKPGIQFQENIRKNSSEEEISMAGFEYLELPYEMVEEYETWGERERKQLKVSGILLKGNELDEDTLFDALMKGEALNISYLLIQTFGMSDHRVLSEVIENCLELITDKEITVLLENSCREDELGRFLCNSFSDSAELKKMAEDYNTICGKGLFGTALNVGRANLTGKNLRVMAEEFGETLKLVHMNDNAGIHDEKQMPFTFTKGRGTRTTDWFRLAGTLVRMKFEGFLMFDTDGLFEQAPPCLYPSFYALMKRIAEDFEAQMHLEEKLNQPDKKLILFGTGAMAYNYMCEWAWKYPPAFFVDNNSSLWGKECYGVPVKSPEAIMEIPESERNIWICNRYYKQIGAQLENMGVRYNCYNDNYYM